jgi:nitrite reductase/ring-hydroxylating ferredoxin subunit
MHAHRLCALADLDDPGSRAFTVGAGAWPLRGFVVRRGREVYAYVNRCPHAGHPLNLRPDQFLALDGAFILCQSHGALFDIERGNCVAGPCSGRSLARLSVRIENESVMLEDDIDALAREHS